MFETIKTFFMLMSIDIKSNLESFVKKYLIVHFGQFETLCYQTSVFNSIIQNDKDSIIDLVIKQPISSLKYIDLVRKSMQIPHSFWERRKFITQLSNNYDFVINMHRDDYEESLKFIKKIKCKNKIGYNLKRKNYSIELSKEKKDHIIDHYLKVCDSLDITKTRKIALKIIKKDKQNSFNLLIKCKKWNKDKILDFIKLPLLRHFKITIFEDTNNLGSEVTYKSWSKVNVLNVMEPQDLINFDVIISDEIVTKCYSDYLEIALIYLTDKSNSAKEKYPIHKKSYVVSPRTKSNKINDIEVDAIVQALNLIIDSME